MSLPEFVMAHLSQPAFLCSPQPRPSLCKTLGSKRPSPGPDVRSALCSSPVPLLHFCYSLSGPVWEGKTLFVFKECEQMWLLLAGNMLLCWSILPRNLGNLWTARRFPFDLWFISGSVLLKSTGALCSSSHSEGPPIMHFQTLFCTRASSWSPLPFLP